MCDVSLQKLCFSNPMLWSKVPGSHRTGLWLLLSEKACGNELFRREAGSGKHRFTTGAGELEPENRNLQRNGVHNLGEKNEN